MRMVKVLLCGSSAVRSRLRRHVEQVSQDAQIVGEAPSVDTVALLTRRFAPHLVLVGDEPEDGDFASLVAEIQGASPQHAYIVLMPEHAPADEEIPGAEAVLARNRYSNRAMVAVLRRIVQRM